MRPTPPVDRRNFLRGSAALAVGAPLVQARALGAPRADDPDVLRVGLVGCGGRGSGAALNALNAEGGTVVLTAMGDVFADRLESSHTNLGNALLAEHGETGVARLAVPEEQRFTGFDALDKVLATDIDVVILTTPPHFRPAHLAAAVAAGKHVFCEKPVAVDPAGVRSVLASARAAKEAGLALVSGFCWRYNPPHRAVYGRVLGGDLGEIQSVYSTYNTGPLGTHPRQEAWSDMEWQLRNWQHFLWLSGDHMVEQAVHSIDKMAWAFGDRAPRSCTAIGGRQARSGAESGNIYDHFGVTYDYDGGAKAFHMCRQIANCTNDNSDWIWGTKGRAEHNRIHIPGQETWAFEGEPANMYQVEHDELFASIRAGAPLNDGEWMSQSTLMAIMARQAAYTGRTITWDEIQASQDRLGPDAYGFEELDFREVSVPGHTKFV